MKKALGIAIMMGMIFAGIVTIADGSAIIRYERWDRGRNQMRQWGELERYRRMWFNTTFALELDHLILFRAKDVFSRALHDTKESNKDSKEVYKTFEYQLRKTIGDENFEKVTKSLRPERGRWDIKIGDQGRSRRSRAREKKRESRNRGSDEEYKPRSKDDVRKHLGKDKPNTHKKGGDKTGTHKTKNKTQN